jgi:hypothetical protein
LAKNQPDMKLVLLLICLVIKSTAATCQQKTEALLMGTFHFNNPGQDVVKTKTFDILSAASQQELENITDRIKGFNPTKIFVEWEHTEQAGLDSLYQQYLDGNFEKYIQAKFPNAAFYQKNEIFQLAFRAAKKLKLAKVHAIDVRNNHFPFDSLLASIDEVQQPHLKQQIDSVIKDITRIMNDNAINLSLKKNLQYLNTGAYQKMDLGFYLQYFNPAGKPTNFVGAHLVSEWYKRNLYIYSLLQKYVQPTDERVMLLFGASHVSLLREFVKFDAGFRYIDPLPFLQ